MPVDVLDIIALILGVFYTRKKLDVRRRVADQFPAVQPADFERWQKRAGFAFSLGSWACFVKIVSDFGFVFLSTRLQFETWFLRAGGMAIDGCWLLALIVATVMSADARRLGQELGTQPRQDTAAQD